MANHVFQKGGWWSKSAKCTEGIIKTASRLTYVLLHTCTLFQFSLSLVISYKKRRVADLLSNFIPDGEATLMKNGRWFCFIPGCLGQCLTHSNSQSHSQRNVLSPHCRYSCLVCSHRPVFDTVDMLVVHRKGKRHLEGEILRQMYLLSFSVNQHSGFKSSLVLICRNEMVLRQKEST